MRPVKSLVPLAKWLLRIAAAVIIYHSFFNLALTFKFNGFGYFVALAFVVFGVTLIVGGFMSNAKLTVISGLLIFILCLIQVFAVQSLNLNNLLSIFPLAALGMYFLARGNQG